MLPGVIMSFGIERIQFLCLSVATRLLKIEYSCGFYLGLLGLALVLPPWRF